jgi:Tfp pilus assembly protein PilO
VARVLLVLVLVAEGYLIQNLYGAKAVEVESVGKAREQLQALQKELKAEQDKVKELEAQLTKLKEQRQAEQETYLQLTGNRVDWPGALSALLWASTAGVSIQSLEGKPGGELRLVAEASDARTFADFQARVRQLRHIVSMQSVEWQGDKNGILVTVTIEVRE